MSLDKYYENLIMLKEMKRALNLSMRNSSGSSERQEVADNLSNILNQEEDLDEAQGRTIEIEEEVEDTLDENNNEQEDEELDAEDIDGLNTEQNRIIAEIRSGNLSGGQIQEKLREIGEKAPADWEPSAQFVDFVNDLVRDEDVSLTSTAVLSMFFGIEENYINSAKAAVNPTTYFSNETLKKVFPGEYSQAVSDAMSEANNLIPEEYKKVFFAKFVSNAGGSEELSKNLIQIGTKKGYNKTLNYGDGESLELTDSAANDARINLVKAIALASKDVMLYAVGFGDEESISAANKSIQFPLKNDYSLTSGYGMRFHPIKKRRLQHHGIDVGAREGTPIYPIMEGVVDSVRETKGGGKEIVIKHKDGYKSRYLHCSKIWSEQGDEVSYGTKIAEVGSTGAVTGPHLHLEIYKDGVILDPEEVFKEFSLQY